MEATTFPIMIGRRLSGLQGDERGKTEGRKRVPVNYMRVRFFGYSFGYSQGVFSFAVVHLKRNMI